MPCRGVLAVVLSGVVSAALLTSAVAGARLDIRMVRIGSRAAEIRISNPTTESWCLIPVSFLASQFGVLISGKLIASRSAHANLRKRCISIAPGSTIVRPVDLTGAFSDAELRRGKLCYTFSYTAKPIAPSPTRSAVLGTICEGRSSKAFIAPN